MGKNYFWIDVLKAVAAFSVIILHVSGSLLNEFNDKEQWWVGNLYDSLVRFCVPVFVMISGVLLLGRDESLSNFLKKRFTRLLFPFFLWSIIYLILKIDYNLPIQEIVLESFKKLKNGTEFHLWYIYMIIGIYLFIPIINKWIIHANKKEILYFILIWLLIIILKLPVFEKLYTRIDLRYFSGFLGYLILGYYLNHYLQLKRYMALGFFFVGYIVTIFATCYISSINRELNEQFYDYLSLNVIIASVGVFMYFKNYTIENKFVSKIIVILSKYSYGIYLSHILVLTLFSKIEFTYRLFNFWIGIPIISISCLLLSLMLTYIISKIPIIGKYISG